MRSCAIAIAIAIALGGVACAVDVTADALRDAGAVAVVDAGAMSVDAGAVAVAEEPLTPPLTPAPAAFRFVRMRTPTAGGDEIVRIALDERVRSVDGVIETRDAPSAASLAPLVALCASRDVERALRKPGDTAPSMTIVELGCAPVAGVVACATGAGAGERGERDERGERSERGEVGEVGCPSVFAPLRDAVVAAWRGDADEAPPASGLTVQATRWQGARATAASNEARATTLTVAGKSLLPAKGERPWQRVPAGKRASLCSDRACVDVTAPALVHLDVIEHAARDGHVEGIQHRFRCASCTPAHAPRGPDHVDVDGGAAGDSLSKAELLRVLKDATAPVRKECGRAAGPSVVRVTFTVMPEGTVISAVDASAAESARGHCAASAVSRLRFPRSSSTTPVTFPFSFAN